MSGQNGYSSAPQPSYRLIPSKFPPIELFDTVSTAADLRAVMEVEGWTNDRLVVSRLARLPEPEWVYGRSNASIVMAAFLHVQPQGARFNSAELGAWYASELLMTAIAEVAHHLRRELVAQNRQARVRRFRCYTASLTGDYFDIRGLEAKMQNVYRSDSYAVGQALGKRVRASGGVGILYDSIRHTGSNVVCYRPTAVLSVVQDGHFEIRVQASARQIFVKRLSNSGNGV